MADRVRTVRVLIVDDHPHGREGMRTVLESDRTFEIAAEAVNGEEAIRLASELEPDLILMDINMPGMGGLEATQRIKAAQPYIKIVMVTVSDDITDLFEAIKRGAQGYLLKNLKPSSWHEYLRAIAVDEAPMSKELAFRILQEFSSRARSGTAEDDPIQGEQAQAAAASRRRSQGGVPVSPLTPRETEILERVAKGESNREIASLFHLSEHTVKNHLKNILQKLHLDNRVQLARYAMEQGIAKGPFSN
ncbi:response regulator [Paenibacillus sp. GCM10012307]|uniref:Response regulator transcription factor n=1 Tax=Paenibacillus roseus TaxID=2798579 RepID=A0A934J357_9BACL|nr:response regulator transcription factor [Paenibacillus roseus]MBJ6363901.1 response regulator transcription factor [Paenibacillus roseus]